MTTTTAPNVLTGKVRPPPSTRRRRRAGALPYGLLTPFFVLFAAFTIAPLVYAAYLSLYHRTLTGTDLYVGLSNFHAVVSDPQFWSGFLDVVVLSVVQVPVMLGISVFAAVAIDMGLVRFGNAFRLLYFMPFAVPSVVAAILWGYLLVPDLSPFDAITKQLGLGTPDLLGQTVLWPVLGTILTWELVGYNMLIVFTALQAVPPELTEAAVIDGAGAWTIARRVRIPNVRGAILLTTLFSMIGTLQLFTEPQLLSNLTPSVNSHLTPNLYLYTQAFSAQDANMAAAGALILALIIGVASAVIMLAMRRASARSSR